MRVVSLAEVQAAIGLDEVRGAVRAALVSAAQGRVVLPGVLHLDLGEERGDLHIKSAWLRDQLTFTVKVAGAFPGAGRRGRNIGKVAAARRLLTLVFYGLRDGHIRCLEPAA